MKYDIKKPAPDWAIREARRRLGFQTKCSHILKWENAIKALRHCAWLIATYEKAPIDPLVLKARKIYCEANGIDETYVEKTGGWNSATSRPHRVKKIMEILNAEA